MRPPIPIRWVSCARWSRRSPRLGGSNQFLASRRTWLSSAPAVRSRRAAAGPQRVVARDPFHSLTWRRAIERPVFSHFLPPRLSSWRSCVEDTSPVGGRRQVYPAPYRHRWPDGGISDRTFADVGVERRASACRSGRRPCEPVHCFGRDAWLGWRERK